MKIAQDIKIHYWSFLLQEQRFHAQYNSILVYMGS